MIRIKIAQVRPEHLEEMRRRAIVAGNTHLVFRSRQDLVLRQPATKAAPTKQPSRGLGDTIAKITSAVGIKPCGKCKKRQALLNKLVPYVKTAPSSIGVTARGIRAGHDGGSNDN